MEVYRVENEHGEGPYRSEDMDYGYLPIVKSHTYDAPKVPPVNDGFPKYSPRMASFAFGFKTLAQYHRWFTFPERREMQLRGFHLSKYRVDSKKTAEGRNQLAFDIRNSTLVETRSLT